MNEPVKIFVARDSWEAHHVKGLLQGEGINSMVIGDPLSRGLPLSHDMMPSVWVSARDAVAAAKVVHDWIGPGDREPEDVVLAAWKCPNCGEEVEGQFVVCWNCGLVREGTRLV